MSGDVNCPYCGADNDINHDDGYGYDEDCLHNQECHSCEKTFAFTTSIHFMYAAKKADCLNGGAHRFEKTKTWPPEHARFVCLDCGRIESKLPAGQGEQP